MKGADLDLVRRGQRGEHGAFDELVERHGPELYRLAVAVIGVSGAADVTQEALLRAWRELPTLRDPDRFGPWARRILVNHCRDLARRDRRGVRFVPLDAAEADGSATVTPDPAPAIDRRSDLAASIATLSVDHRSILALHYVLDLPIREVAATLGIPDGTAKSRLSAALATLRQAISEVDA